MRRIPAWFEQMVGGLSDGKGWLVSKYRELPAPIRASGWLAFQAVLFKIQPHLWRGLLEVVELASKLLTLPVHVQLLLVIITLLVGQTVLTENRFNRTWRIVEYMDSPQGNGRAATDGGLKSELRSEAYKRSSWRIYVVCCAIIGGVVGVGLGPAGVIGLSVLGAMVGDEWAQRVLED